MSLAGCHEGWLATCGYGPFDVGWIRKEFAFLGVNCDPMEMNRRCPGHHQHVQLSGQLTTKTASYHPLVADAMAALAVRT
eukprot:11756621-Heterocapsa_arctica.AAC.1